jgi:homoserine kinase
MITVRVPATSANMGAGFDTLGVALSLYNTLQIEELERGLDIRAMYSTDYIPRNENNLVYRAMKTVFDEVGYPMRGLRIIQNSQIPVTRGLGSSSACIIGGMIAANILSGRHLEYEDILNFATKMEGHPDNVAPALYGGFCISAVEKGKTVCESVKLDSNIKFAVMIPDYFVATRKSRGTLPDKVTYPDAAFNISRAALFTAAMISGKLSLLRTGVQDRLHQPYRSVYIEGMDTIFEKTYSLGARATYLSGSGPTILSILDGDTRAFQRGMIRFFQENSHQWRCKVLSCDNVGTVVKINH